MTRYVHFESDAFVYPNNKLMSRTGMHYQYYNKITGVFYHKLTHLLQNSIFQLPFSTVGSLNGVHMFCKSQGALLQNVYLDDGTVVVWKDFENCFTMIGIGKNITEKVIVDLLYLAFNAMIYTIGLNEIKLNKNSEQMKRELKVSAVLLRG